MTALRFGALFGCVFVLLTLPAQATDRIKLMGPMKGLKKLAIELVVSPGDDARECGLERNAILGAAGPPMETMGIKTDVRGQASVYRVRLLVNMDGGRCTAYVSSELLVTMPLYMPHMGPANEAYLPTSTVRLWSAGELVILPVEGFAAHVVDLVGRHAESLAVRWQKDNNAS
jgi:hypothetical protein